MVEMETQKPQISDMFQKLAVAFKTKTFELFADDDQDSNPNPSSSYLLLDSSEEELILDQKVVVIKPDPPPTGPTNSGPTKPPRVHLIPSLFATISEFSASYLQFQAAHVPIPDSQSLQAADKSIISILQKLSTLKNQSFSYPHPQTTSFLDFQVQENQSKLRSLETVVNSLQLILDSKVDLVNDRKSKLDRIRACNFDLSKKLDLGENLNMGVLLSVGVFEGMLNDSIKGLRCFTKLLIGLMSNAGWDLEEAAGSVYSDVDYTKKGHFRYAFLSYVSLVMFKGFDDCDFGLGSDGNEENVGNEDNVRSGYMRELIEHVGSDPMEVLRKDKKSGFSRFCERKYEELIHPSMECSIFGDFGMRDNKVLDSWKELTVFYEAFVRMASSVWVVHKLAYSFSPVVEIFQVERGVEFSMVYMEDVLGKLDVRERVRPRVGFTVFPGFKVGRTVIQSQVYVTRVKETD